MTLLDITICIIVLVIGFNLKFIFRSLDKRDHRFLNKLFAFHILISLAFAFLVSQNGGDAQLYWSFPKDNSWADIMDVVQRGSASGIIYSINYIPSKILDLSFYTGNICYGLLGHLGFVYFYMLLKSLFGDTKKLHGIKAFRIPIYPLIWFLPNLHFWSSGIGKDTILFFCIALFIYSIQKLKTRWLGLLLSVILSLAIRPHMIFFLIFSFGLANLLDHRMKGYTKILLFGIFIITFIYIFNFVIDFIQLESLDSAAVEEYARTKASKLNQADSSSGVDISAYPYPLKVFTFLYRPLFFDINGLLAVLASFENFFLLLVTISIFRNKPWAGLRKSDSLIKGLLLFFLCGAATFPLILGNLGIMLRQKNPFIPCLLIIGIWMIYNNRINVTAQ